ncbi:hypothetical protein TNCV_782091 [Trichonephila clavipes]|nr:hypothetical protein TNCV_782091 [Trichonephila clavipes]
MASAPIMCLDPSSTSMINEIFSSTNTRRREHANQNGVQFLFTTVNKGVSGIKEIILDARFPKPKNRRLMFLYGDGERLTSEHVALFMAPSAAPK